jgi:hypothetical protein
MAACETAAELTEAGACGFRIQNLKPAPIPLPVMTGSTLLDVGAGVDNLSGTVTARRCEAAFAPDATVLPPRESRPLRDGGGGTSVRGRTPGALVLQPAKEKPNRIRADGAISLRIMSLDPCCANLVEIAADKIVAARQRDGNRKSPVFPPGFFLGT